MAKMTSNAHGELKLNNKTRIILKKVRKEWQKKISLDTFANCWQNKATKKINKQLYGY